MSLFLQQITEKFSLRQLVLTFNGILLIGGGGILALLRATNDLYAPVPDTSLNVTLMGAVFFIAIVLFIGMLLCLFSSQQLNIADKALVFVCFVEILFFGFLTQQVFALPLLDHAEISRKSIEDTVIEINQNKEAKRKGSLTLVNAYIKGPLLVFQYKGDGNTGFFADAMRKELEPEACQYFDDYPEHNVLASVSYIFTIGNAQSIIAITHQDCTSAQKSSQSVAPASLQQEERKSIESASPLPAPPSLSNTTDMTAASVDLLTSRTDSLQAGISLLAQNLKQLEAPLSGFSDSRTDANKKLQAKLDVIDKQIDVLSSRVVSPRYHNVAIKSSLPR